MTMRILGIDFSAMFRRNWEATGGKELSEAFRRTVDSVSAIRQGFDRVALLCDSGTSFRRSLLPAYKADREPLPASFYEQQNRTVSRLMADGCVAFTAPAMHGFDGDARWSEADDLCASLAVWCVANGHQLIIVGGDKDLLQCVTDPGDISVGVLRPGHENIWYAQRVRESDKIGVPPERIPDWLALGGDMTDGFKMFPGWTDQCEKCGSERIDPACKVCKGKGSINRPGIGPGNATSLLQKFGTLMAVVDAACAEPKEGEAPAFPPCHQCEVIRRAKPSPTEAAGLGLRLATLVQDLPVDWSVLEEEPQVEAIADEPKAMAPAPDGEDASSTAMTVAHRSSGLTRFGEQYRNAQAMMDLAERFYNGRFFGSFPNPESLFTVMWLAAERGDNVGHALVNAYVTKAGKPPGYLAVYLAARIKSSGLCKVFRIVESTADHATLEYQRTDEEGEPHRYTFQLHEAQSAGWVRDDSPWKTRPRVMCRNAVMREVAKFHWPEVCSGMNDADEFVLGS